MIASDFKIALEWKIKEDKWKIIEDKWKKRERGRDNESKVEREKNRLIGGIILLKIMNNIFCQMKNYGPII